MDFKKFKKSQDFNKSDESPVVIRDSFSHRFCNDLSEVVLNFLPIDHKIKLTEVSKQFQRCLQNIYPKQRILIIRYQFLRDSMYDRNNYSELLTYQSYGDRLFPRIDVKKFVKVLQIFPNINEIYIEKEKIFNISDVFEAIIDNCSHLTSLRLDSGVRSLDTFKRFGQKFGHQIRNLWSLKRIYLNDSPLEVIELPNIVSLFDFQLRDLFINDKLLIKNLKKATFSVLLVCDKQLFETFIGNNLDLIHLGLHLTFGSGNDGTHYLQKVLTLNKLRKLDLKIGSEDKQFFPDYTEIDINIIKKCHHLTHLTLDCHSMDDHFFTDFDKAFPHLKCLNIAINYHISDKALEWISKLKLLESLSLKCFRDEFNSEPQISDSGVMALINGCKRLRRLELHLNTNISGNVTFECFENKIDVSLKEKDYQLWGY